MKATCQDLALFHQGWELGPRDSARAGDVSLVGWDGAGECWLSSVSMTQEGAGAPGTTMPRSLSQKELGQSHPGREWALLPRA